MVVFYTGTRSDRFSESSPACFLLGLMKDREDFEDTKISTADKLVYFFAYVSDLLSTKLLA